MRKEIDRYEVRREIGHGGVSVVYLAYDPRVGREVAIKVLTKEYSDDPDFRKQFAREVKSIVELEHSAIVPVYDYGQDDGQPFLVMKLMSGGSLEQRLDKRPQTLEEAIAIFA